MKRLRHGAEIGDQAGGETAGERQRMTGPIDRQPAQMR
jgi:hypothetical protein